METIPEPVTRTARYYPGTVTVSSTPGVGGKVQLDGDDEDPIAAVNATGHHLRSGTRVLVEFVGGSAIIFGVTSEPYPFIDFTPEFYSGTIAGAAITLQTQANYSSQYRNDRGIVTAMGREIFTGTGHTIGDKVVFVVPTNLTPTVRYVGGTWSYYNDSLDEWYSGVFKGLSAADETVEMLVGGSSNAQFGAAINSLELGDVLQTDVSEAVEVDDELWFWLHYRSRFFE